jgi:adenosine deaminase
MTPISQATIDHLPKAVLHEHLDGGLRVGTIIELADQIGYGDLPSTDEKQLAEWFHRGKSGSLERYLEAFEHTVAVMQDQECIRRVAFESVQDLADDGVVYAEIRFAPSLNTKRGLPVEAILEAAHDGIADAAGQHRMEVGLIVTAMRQETDSASIARTAVRSQNLGVVGFDLAGPEAGFPPTLHTEACHIARAGGLGLTIHAGEGDGPHSMWQALNACGASRIGHGVRVAEDTDFDGHALTELGPFARTVRDRRVPLEVAITSNLHTGVYRDVAAHPFGQLYRNGFNVSINTDNRLMSGVTMSSETALAANTFDLDLDDLECITINTLEAGFLDYPTRRRIIDEVVRPGYSGARIA